MLNVFLLGITSFLTDLSSEMIYPLVPLYLTIQLGATPVIVGIIEGIAESLASILKVFSGSVSDRINKRKPLVIIGYSCSSIGKLFFYVSNSWLYVLIGRIVDRFGKGIRTAPRDALISESIEQKNRGKAFGFHRALDTLGAVFGVIATYYLFFKISTTASTVVYKKIFLYSLIPAVLGIFVLFYTRETCNGKCQKKQRFSLKGLVSKIHTLPLKLKYFLIISFLFNLGNSSNQFLLLRANNLGFTAVTVILLYLVYNISYTLFSYPAGKISDILGRKSLIVIGYFIYGIVYLGFAVIKSPGLLWLLFILYGIYMGLTEGVEKAFVADNSPQETRATLLGMHATLVGIGLLPASIIAGFLWKILGPSATFYFGAITGILSGFAFLLLI